MNTKKVNWGIVGLGAIAHHFVKDLLLIENVKLIAVASRNTKKAEDFAKTYKAKNYYDSYEKLFEDPIVDIVYIATPHHNHAAISIKAMSKGKHVLCEKPLAVHFNDASRMILSAQENNVFFMEALWSRFNPVIQKIQELLQEGAIGTLNYINADFSFFVEKNKDGRLYNMSLAGGALLDIGIYPLFLSYLFFGVPDTIDAHAIFDDGGADIQTSMLLKYKNGISNLYCGFKSNSDMVAKVCGTEGTILIDRFWYKSEGFTLIKNDGTKTKYNLPKIGSGYYYEIIECNNCILNRKTESRLWPHKNSLDLIAMMDEIREKINLKYPFE